jgi:hypothetical protein
MFSKMNWESMTPNFWAKAPWAIAQKATANRMSFMFDDDNE